jgi:acyl-CoA synthetase (AMP-forming)/AMP-acid ligase II
MKQNPQMVASGQASVAQGSIEVPTSSFSRLVSLFDYRGSDKALTFYHSDEIQNINYSQLKAATLGWCAFLQQRFHVGEETYVAICLRNDLCFVPIALAVIMLGAVLVPFNPESDEDFVRAALALTDIKVAVLEAELGSPLRDIFAEYVGDSFVWASLNAPEVLTHIGLTVQVPSTPALMLFTSGTTGRPRGVVLSQAALLANAQSMIDNFGLERTTQLAVMPLFHAHAFGFGLMTALLSGGHLVITRGLSPSLWKRAIQEQSVTFTSVAPPLLQLLLAMLVKQSDVPSLRAILVSSAPLPHDLAEAFVRRSGIRLIHGWGLSEYTNFATCLKVDEGDDYYRTWLLEHKWPTVGHTLAGTKIEVRNADGMGLGPGQIGELWVSGPSTMLGYHANEVATLKTIQNGWLRSGDLGYWLDSPQGRLYFVTGRLKEIIIRAGEKIAPISIELALRRLLPHIDQKHWAVVGYPHAIYGEEIGLYINRAIGMDPNHLAKALLQMTPDMRPKSIFVGVEEIPVTPTGKVQRLKLQTHFAGCENDSSLVRVMFDPRLSNIEESA